MPIIITGRIMPGIPTYDHKLQVWTNENIVEPCSHPYTMRQRPGGCCNQHRYAGLHIEDARIAHAKESK